MTALVGDRSLAVAEVGRHTLVPFTLALKHARRLDQLEAAIQRHNAECLAACAARADGTPNPCGYQHNDGRPIYGKRRCPECPKNYMIEVEEVK